MEKTEKEKNFYCKKYKKNIPFNCSLCVFEKKCEREKYILMKN